MVSDKVPAKSRGLNWKSPGYAVTDDSPVAQVTWNDACAYCAWLSEQEQRTPWYRSDGKGGWLIAAQATATACRPKRNGSMPAEPGRRRSIRLVTTTPSESSTAGTTRTPDGKAQPVALKLPNPFGLFDMHGNLQEWCQDFFDEKWYEKPQPNDPKAQLPASTVCSRGGNRGDDA